MHVKIFSSTSSRRAHLTALESEVNAWLEQAEPHVISLKQSALGGDLVLTFLYEERISTSAEATAEATAAIPDAIGRSLEETTLDPTSDAPLLPEAELPY